MMRAICRSVPGARQATTKSCDDFRLRQPRGPRPAARLSLLRSAKQNAGLPLWDLDAILDLFFEPGRGSSKLRSSTERHGHGPAVLAEVD